jgi:hypothetical protein
MGVDPHVAVALQLVAAHAVALQLVAAHALALQPVAAHVVALQLVAATSWVAHILLSCCVLCHHITTL